MLNPGGVHPLAESFEHECPTDCSFMVNFFNAGIAITLAYYIGLKVQQS